MKTKIISEACSILVSMIRKSGASKYISAPNLFYKIYNFLGIVITSFFGVMIDMSAAQNILNLNDWKPIPRVEENNVKQFAADRGQEPGYANRKLQTELFSRNIS